MITSQVYLEYLRSYILIVIVLVSTFKNKNSLRSIEAEISQKIKNNETRPNFTGSYEKTCKDICSLASFVSQDNVLPQAQKLQDFVFLCATFL